MPELTAGFSRAEVRKKKEEEAFKGVGANGWRAGGQLLVTDAQQEGGDARSRSPAREVERLAQIVAPIVKEAAAASDPVEAVMMPLEKAKALAEKEREKARLKKLAREQEQRERAEQREQALKERAGKKGGQVKRY
mmetsp:Transcript_48285/g.108529  ORF Transcript_48285/g.108529 Transcript_48285/m.108529 type:complete len:136 (+) Transcript_48285:100-507(+)